MSAEDSDLSFVWVQGSTWYQLLSTLWFTPLLPGSFAMVKLAFDAFGRYCKVSVSSSSKPYLDSLQLFLLMTATLLKWYFYYSNAFSPENNLGI